MIGIGDDPIGRLFAAGVCVVITIWLMSALSRGKMRISSWMTARRQTTPVMYWLVLFNAAIVALGSGIMAIFGWGIVDRLDL